MAACYDVYHEQVLFSGAGETFPNPYHFMVSYHNYAKFLPMVMYFRSVFTKKQIMGASVKTLLDRGCSYNLIELFVGTAKLRDVRNARSPIEKRKRRRLTRIIKSDPIRQLYCLAQGILSLDGCGEIYPLVLSFLL